MQKKKRKANKRNIRILFRWLLTFSLLCGGLYGCGKEETAYFLTEERSTQEGMQKEPETEMDETGTVAGQESEAPRKAEETDASAVCFVHICGAVKSPGVYELTEGSRIFEAVALAGGLTEDACLEAVNQAQKISDGMKIFIPTTEQAGYGGNAWEQEAVESGEGTGEPAAEALVNINTADKELLKTLPGIGESRADSILAYRKEKGGFKSTEEIMQVSGIKEGAYQKIKDKICVQ